MREKGPRRDEIRLDGYGREREREPVVEGYSRSSAGGGRRRQRSLAPPDTPDGSCTRLGGENQGKHRVKLQVHFFLSFLAAAEVPCNHWLGSWAAEGAVVFLAFLALLTFFGANTAAAVVYAQ